MKKNTLVLFFVITTVVASFAQTRKGSFKLSASASHELYVSFVTELNFGNSDNYTQTAIMQVPDIQNLVNQYNLHFEKGIAISDEKLTEMENRASHIFGKSNSVSKLRNIFKVKIDTPSNERLFELAGKLEKLQAVEYCSLMSLEPIKPSNDISPTTSSFEPMQTYIGANPGVNMQYAWDLGLSGSGIRIRDVEYGFNKNHEEFADINAAIASGMTINTDATIDYTEHGTSVFGIVYANKGSYGVSGLAYGAQEMLLFPEWQQIGYDRAFAVAQSISNSSPGDVIIYEMQEYGENSAYVCAEFNSVIWDLTKAATDSGIVVVAAAGNGGQDLDAIFYQEYRDRGNSGAIIVGAGTSDTLHDKIYYSTYGSRVDLQAWGMNVYTTGYLPNSAVGSYLINNDLNQSYSTAFSGTSSATPIVASCAVVLQSYYYSLTNNYLTSPQIRTILKNTGIAQGNFLMGNIGPIPNMQAAIQAVYNESLSNNENVKTVEFFVLPNPATDWVSIISNSVLSDTAELKIYNSLGQIVSARLINGNLTVDLSNLAKGLYYVKVTDKDISSIKKIIKK